MTEEKSGQSENNRKESPQQLALAKLKEYLLLLQCVQRVLPWSLLVSEDSSEEPTGSFHPCITSRDWTQACITNALKAEPLQWPHTDFSQSLHGTLQSPSDSD